jgi:hypothetical protein
MSGYSGMLWNAWSPEEVAILEQFWPEGGYRVVQEHLPHRSKCSIQGRAFKLQLKIPTRTPARPQPSSDWIDAAIRREYRQGKPQLKPLGKQLDRTVGWLKWRACQLGVTRMAPGVETSPWSPEEQQYLESALERGLSATAISKGLRKLGFNRTASAIVVRIGKQGLVWSREWWTAMDVARALNVDCSVPLKWIRAGKLKAIKTHGMSATQELQSQWKVKPADVRRMMLNHPELWDHRRMNQEILLDLLCGGKYGLTEGAFGAGAVHLEREAAE